MKDGSLTTPCQQTCDARERSRQASSWAGRAKRSSFLAPRRAGLTLVDAALGQESLELSLDVGRLQQQKGVFPQLFFPLGPMRGGGVRLLVHPRHGAVLH